MHIKLKLFGTLRRFSDPGTPGLWQGDVPSGTRVEDLIIRLGTRTAEVAAAAINGEVIPLESEIPDGATVTLVTPVGGG